MKEYIIILILLSLIFIISVYGLSKKKIEGFTEGTQGSSFVSRIPKGLISAFYGSQTDLQNVLSQGWALCDGTNNTPNLSGRFILGQGGKYSANSTGGNETIVIAGNNLPSHNHNINYSYVTVDGSGGTLTISANPGNIDGSGSNANGTISNLPAYGNASGGADAISIMPPYYVLAYIMKL